MRIDICKYIISYNAKNSDDLLFGYGALAPKEGAVADVILMLLKNHIFLYRYLLRVKNLFPLD
jgi:hypothetical protein